MKRTFSLIAILLIFLSINAQKTMRIDAVKGTDYGISYNLPKTAIEVIVEYSKVTRTAGEFYMYADRYLSITDPIIENSTDYKLEKLDTRTIGRVDKSNAFLVEFRSNSAAAFMTLTEDGLICAINDNYIFPQEEKISVGKEGVKKQLNPHQYFSEEILRAGSSAKQAELIAKQIYRVRETRNDILTGEADNMPPDGDSYKLVMRQLDDQELALTSLFIGTEVIEPSRNTIIVDVDNKSIKEKVVVRFSTKLGLVASNNLAGEAIYLTLEAHKEKEALILSLKETNEREKKFAKGIVYNIPAKANLKLEYKNVIHVNKETDVVQFGDQDVLLQGQIGDKNNPLKVVFYPELGAIKQTGRASF